MATRSDAPRLLTVTLVLALAAGACFGDGPPEVEVASVGSGQVTEVVSAPARVEAAARQEVAATVPGTVAALAVADGDEVRAGQVIVRLTSEQVEQAAEQAAAAQQAAAQGTPQVAVSGGGGALQQTVRDAVAELDASVQPHLAEARAQAEALTDPKQQQLALAAVVAAEAAYRATRETLLATGASLAAQQDASARSLSRALNQAAAQTSAAQQDQATALATAAEAEAAALTLTAPFDGVVRLGSASAAGGPGLTIPEGLDAGGFGAGLGGGGDGGGSTLRVGAPVAPGQVLFTVFDLSTMYLRAAVDEVDAPQVSRGQEATALVDAFADLSFAGTVEAVGIEATTTEAGGVGYPTRVRLGVPGPDAEGALRDAYAALRPGMTAGVDIVTATVDADVVIPSRALLRREGDTVVWVVRDGRVEVVAVTVDALAEDTAAVTGGFRADDRVVVAGYEDLVEGEEVRVRTE